MTIIQTKENSALIIALKGRLDTTTAPELERALEESLVGVERLTMDLKELEYLSSAGLRVLLTLQKKMNKQGKMVVRNVSDTVLEVLRVTGFTEILTIVKK